MGALSLDKLHPSNRTCDKIKTTQANILPLRPRTCVEISRRPTRDLPWCWHFMEVALGMTLGEKFEGSEPSYNKAFQQVACCSSVCCLMLSVCLRKQANLQAVKTTCVD